MASPTDFLAPIAGLGTTVVITITLVIIIVLMLGLAAWLIFVKKRWNLKCEFKMLRSDGHFVAPEWGKARYDPKFGVIYIKRKRKKAESIHAKRLDKYLQGNNTITVIGNPGAWKLVIPDSYTEVMDDETGEVASILNLRTDTKEDKAWAVQWERFAGQTFTIQNFLQQYSGALQMGFVILITIIANFIGFSLVLQKIGK